MSHKNENSAHQMSEAGRVQHRIARHRDAADCGVKDQRMHGDPASESS